MGHRWAVEHPPPFAVGSFEACVIYHESTDNKYARNGQYLSYYQWASSTYERATAAAGIPYKYPMDASLKEQTLAFRAYEPSHPTEWPQTVPECGG